jgi:hypothetical protein
MAVARTRSTSDNMEPDIAEAQAQGGGTGQGMPEGPEGNWGELIRHAGAQETPDPIGSQQRPRDRATEPGAVLQGMRQITATPTMPTRPTPVAGMPPSPMQAPSPSPSPVARNPAMFGDRAGGLMGRAGGLLGGGLGVGDTSNTEPQSILQTLVQMLGMS